VAAEEELIKDIRTVAQANREKETVRIAAEASATELSVKQVKAAQASEEVTKIKARERVVAADAELETADKGARAKIRLAEGVQAEAAAEGLAKARVKEADAAASEKLGLTEARVTLEKLNAQATGEEKQGLAKVRVREAEAAAVEKQGVHLGTLEHVHASRSRALHQQRVEHFAPHTQTAIAKATEAMLRDELASNHVARRRVHFHARQRG
jgi:hypothetical protein